MSEKKSDEIFIIKSVIVRDIPTRTINPLPTSLIAAEVNIEFVNSKISFDYTKIQRYDVSNQSVFDQIKFNDVIKRLIGTGPSGSGRNRLRRMRLGINEPVFLAIRLGRSLNWQFMADHPPFMEPVDSAGNRLSTGSFFNADKYIIGPANSPVVSNGDDGCVLAVMIFQPPSASSFTDRFNINVELMMKDHQGGVQKLPIIIDPEVGWPGGTRP